jgi:hypothetical protein
VIPDPTMHPEAIRELGDFLITLCIFCAALPVLVMLVTRRR